MSKTQYHNGYTVVVPSPVLSSWRMQRRIADQYARLRGLHHGKQRSSTSPARSGRDAANDPLIPMTRLEKLKPRRPLRHCCSGNWGVTRQSFRELVRASNIRKSIKARFFGRPPLSANKRYAILPHYLSHAHSTSLKDVEPCLVGSNCNAKPCGTCTVRVQSGSAVPL